MSDRAFIKAVTKVSSGTLLGQFCLIASAPIITRIFDPTSFGLFAIVLAIASICATFINLRYEYAVTVVSDEQEARLLLLGSLLIALANSLVCLVIVSLVARHMESITPNHPIIPLLYVVPVTLIAHGIIQATIHWLLRAEDFQSNAVSKVILGAGQASSQITLGLLNGQAVSLALGYTAGLFGQLVYLLHKSRIWTIKFDKWSHVDLLRSLCKHWKYPVFNAPSALLTSSTQLLPALLIGIIYDPALAGLYALSQRVVGVPVRVVSQAASQVYMAKMPKLAVTAARRLFLRTSLQFLILGIIGAVPVMIWGPTLFAWIFGEAWRQTGEIVRLAMIAYLGRFVVMPVSQTLTIMNRQHWLLVTSIGSLCALLGGFGAGWYFDLTAFNAIAIYSVGWCFMLLVTWWLAWRSLAEGLSTQ